MKLEIDLKEPRLKIIPENKADWKFLSKLNEDFENANLHDVCHMFKPDHVNFSVNGAS